VGAEDRSEEPMNDDSLSFLFVLACLGFLGAAVGKHCAVSYHRDSLYETCQSACVDADGEPSEDYPRCMSVCAGIGP
jgi:hypothetical protein